MSKENTEIKSQRLFFVLTERKRVRNRISFYISEIIDGKNQLIDNDFTVSIGSNRGLINESVNQLIKLKVLDDKYVNSCGYIDYSKKDFNIIHVESADIAYFDFK